MSELPDDITIFCAVTAEAKVVRRVLPGRRIVVTGMGAQRARSAIGRPQCAIVIFGVAGAVSPDLRVGDVIVPEAVVDLRSGRRLHPTWPGASTTPHVLGTSHEVAGDATAKTLLRSRHAIDAVDMETAALAEAAEAAGVPWLCVRGISDAADATVPAFAVDLVDDRGRPRVLRAAASILIAPWRLGALLRLGRDTKIAATAAAHRVAGMLR